MTTKSDFPAFFAAVLEAAFFTDTDAEGSPLDRHYSLSDIHPENIAAIRAHAESFWLRMYYYIDCENPSQTVKAAGHDFWLTSQRHGAGFWDGDWPIYGEMLTKLAKCYPAEMEFELLTQETINTTGL